MKFKFKVIGNGNDHNYIMNSILTLNGSELNYLTMSGKISGLKYDMDDARNAYVGAMQPSFRGNTICIEDLKMVNESTVEESVKIVKKKVRKEFTPDKFKEALVLSLNKDKSTIYLSATLRDTLLHQSNKIGFAFDVEKNAHYIYCEMEEKEGYDVNDEGNMISPSEWRDLYNTFGKNDIHVDSTVVKNNDNPDYLFYQIVGDKVVKKTTRRTATEILASNTYARKQTLSSQNDIVTSAKRGYAIFNDPYKQPTWYGGNGISKVITEVNEAFDNPGKTEVVLDLSNVKSTDVGELAQTYAQGTNYKTASLIETLGDIDSYYNIPIQLKDESSDTPKSETIKQ